MKKKYIIIVVLTLTFFLGYCRGQQEVLFKQIVTQDSGYLQKKEALPIFLMAFIVTYSKYYITH